MIASSNSVFRGSPPSEFFFKLIPSLYNNRIDWEENTGYHSSSDSTPEAGASYFTTDIPFTSDLEVFISLSRSENSLVTERMEK